jgi:hypothetical protein
VGSRTVIINIGICATFSVFATVSCIFYLEIIMVFIFVLAKNLRLKLWIEVGAWSHSWDDVIGILGVGGGEHILWIAFFGVSAVVLL